MTMDFIAFVPRQSLVGVGLPHTPKLFLETDGSRRSKSDGWRSRCRELLRQIGGRKPTDSRN